MPDEGRLHEPAHQIDSGYPGVYSRNCPACVIKSPVAKQSFSRKIFSKDMKLLKTRKAPLNSIVLDFTPGLRMARYSFYVK